MKSREPNSNAARIASVLRERAASYYPEFLAVPPKVELTRAASRPYSELYEFTLTAVDATQAVFVKVPFLDKSRPSVNLDRPRLFPPVVPEQMALLEYTAMRQLEQHFLRRNDPRFGCVRVLDLLANPDAIVMAKASGRTLKATATSFFKPEVDLDRSLAIFRNSGEWLHDFHQLPNLEHTTERTAQRTDFVTATEHFLEYSLSVRGPQWVQPLGEYLIRESKSTLPSALPIGLAHGDFAPRNVIVSHGDRITVLDTLARWRAPIYEDIASFLLSLHLQNSVQDLWSGGRARLARCSSAFIEGYFGNSSHDQDTIRLFMLQALLDRTCSYLSSRSHGSVAIRVKRHCKVHFLKRLAHFYATSNSC